MALDRFGRNIHYLRISLTDHCNLRCVYCMSENMTFRPTAEMMQDDELITLMQLFARLGFEKYRLTGGEPTVRQNVVELVQRMSAVEGVKSLSMTTNGLLLKKLAQPLKNAGLERVNISLDTLDRERFHQITRRDQFDHVWEGIMASEEAGLLPIKINTVVVRGINDQDVADLAGLTLQHPWQIRFIEMMPFAGATDLQLSQTVKDSEILAWIEEKYGPMELLDNGHLDGEARVYRIPGAQGKVGFISSVSLPFCSACTRARLTADGKLRLCLLREKEVDLLTPLRQGASVEDLRLLVVNGIWSKPWGHGLADGEVPLNRTMSEIGG